jgi:hypothetical protein
MRRTLSTPAHAPRAFRALFGGTLCAALALASSACSAVSGEHEAETKFLVKPNDQSTFSGWSEITVSEDPNSVDSAELRFIRLEAQDSAVADLTFIKDITALATVDGAQTKVAQKAPMPPGERIVPLDRVYTGDIRKFFYKADDGDGYTVHIDWHGSVDLSKSIPPEGIWMRVKVAVTID